MGEGGEGAADGRFSLVHVVLPVVLLFLVIALLAGLVFGGVLQGNAPRLGPAAPETTHPTIIIEP